MLDSSRDVCKRRKRAYILDAAGIFASIQLLSSEPCYTTKDVVNEILDEDSRRSLQLAINTGKLIITEPEKQHVKLAERAAEELGELGRLSQADISVISLGLMLREQCFDVIIVTDDYSIQNLAQYLGFKIRGIKRREFIGVVRYVYICPVCGHIDKKPGKCPKCNAVLRRKAIKKIK